MLRWHAVRVVLLLSCYKGTIKWAKYKRKSHFLLYFRMLVPKRYSRKGTIKWAKYKRKSHFLFYFRMPVPKRRSRRGTIKWAINQVSVVLLLTIIIKVFKMKGLFNYYFGCFFVNEYAFFLSKAVWLVLWINSLYMLLGVSERQIKAFFGHVSLLV